MNNKLTNVNTVIPVTNNPLKDFAIDVLKEISLEVAKKQEAKEKDKTTLEFRTIKDGFSVTII